MHPNIPENDDLGSALEAARRPLSAPRLPPAALPVRLRTSPALRRLIPTRLAVNRAEARAERNWRTKPGTREAITQMLDAIVGGTPRAHEAHELAHRHVIEQEVHRALFWQPWAVARIDADSQARLDAVRADGRPLVFSNCHMGPFHLHMSAIATREHHTFAVSAPWFFDPPSHDYWGRRLAHWWRRLEKQRPYERLVYSPGSMEVLRALLEDGEYLLIYYDMPGGRRTQFLGKPVMLATGTARLACETGALVVPLRCRREGHRARVDVGEPIDPRDHGDAEQLQDVLARVHERLVLELPETLEDPNRPGAWEGGASAREWIRGGREGPLSAIADEVDPAAEPARIRGA